MPELIVGKKAPAFTLLDQKGNKVKLSDFQGEKVIVYFYPKADTPGCTTQSCNLRDSRKDLAKLGAKVLGISPDKPETLKSWKQEKNLQYDLLSDPDHKVLDAWSAWGRSLLGLVTLPRTTRSVWVIGEDGHVIDAQVGITPGESVRRALAAIEKA